MSLLQVLVETQSSSIGNPQFLLESTVTCLLKENETIVFLKVHNIVGFGLQSSRVSA